MKHVNTPYYKRMMHLSQQPRIEGRDPPDPRHASDRKVVCKRCHVPMSDFEPCSRFGEFSHPVKNKEGKPHPCKNAGQIFDIRSQEVEPFLRKGDRRRNKRNGVRA